MLLQVRNTLLNIFRSARRQYRRAEWLAKVAKPRLRLTLGKEPLSYEWGAERGEPIYHDYLCQFLTEFTADIHGHCLEFYNDMYATTFGGPNVTKLDILNIDDTNPKATLVGDLTKPNDLPSDTFDCIICTHTLHLIFEMWKAVVDLHRLLKPGGVMLVAVPGVSMCDPGWGECWRFTPEGLQRLLGLAFPADGITLRVYGNSLTAAGQLRGLVAQEFTPAEFNYHDPRFALELCARAVKAGPAPTGEGISAPEPA
jgi:SAM-dependent methyltransferase